MFIELGPVLQLCQPQDRSGAPPAGGVHHWGVVGSMGQVVCAVLLQVVLMAGEKYFRKDVQFQLALMAGGK